MGEPSPGMATDQGGLEVSENKQVGAEMDEDGKEESAKVSDNAESVVEVAVSGLEQVVVLVTENEQRIVVETESRGSEVLLEKHVDDDGKVRLCSEVDLVGDSGLVDCVVGIDEKSLDDDEKARLGCEVDLVDDSELVEGLVVTDEKPSVVLDETEDVVDTGETTLVLQRHENEDHTCRNQIEIDSHENNDDEVKNVNDSDALKPNGHIEPTFVPEDKYNETILKEEKIEGEFSTPIHSFTFNQFLNGAGSGTEEEQVAFMKELETFYKSRTMDFKPPKFYGEGLNCLKLWRAVTKLGGYEQVTSCKLWRQVGESFKPPKTCTTVSWTFRIFYEKALLEYEKHKIQTGELQVPPSNTSEPTSVENQVGGNQGSGSGRARRDAAARAMQGWHSQRLLGNGEVGDPIIKGKSTLSLLKKDKNVKSIGPTKKRKGSSLERGMKIIRTNDVKPQGDIMVDDVGEPADWVKINVRRTKDCFEIYALVPGLLREEVQVQSDPAGRLIVIGDPEQLDNPWGVTPFKKVITLPSRIDPHQTSAVVTLHGQLFVRAPFEQSDL